MKRLLILICFSLGAVPKAPFVPLAERNKQADTAFIVWRVTAPHAEVSAELKKLLTPEARAFIVEQSPLPLDRMLSKAALQKKVQEVSRSFTKKYGSSINRHELDKIIRQVVVPEYVFQQDLRVRDDRDKTYNELLKTLSEYRTKPGTRLDIWALRYLTSEAQFVALSVIERQTLNGKSFNQLEAPEQLKILESAAEVVTRQFMANLEPVRKRYKFTVPPFIGMAVKKRVTSFLREKFGL